MTQIVVQSSNTETTPHSEVQALRNSDAHTRVAIIGCGARARIRHIPQMLLQQDTTVVVLCDPDPTAIAETHKLFSQAGLHTPPNQSDFDRLLYDYGDEIDAILIATPNVYHYQQTLACLEVGLDVLVEKPIARNVQEAKNLINARNQTGRLVVIAVQGSLSSERQHARSLLQSGELGPIHSIHALVWENWLRTYAGSWRQQPNVSGGGFLFDSGIHMLHTVVDLGGEVEQVSALLYHSTTSVDVHAAVIGQLSSGALFTLGACGDASSMAAGSDVFVFTPEATLRTSIWGRYLYIQRLGDSKEQKVHCAPTLGPWQQFLAIRQGVLENPCPPEVGLQVAAFWEAIRASAQAGGVPVKCTAN